MLALFNFLNDNKPLLVPVIDKEAFLKLFNFLQETTLKLCQQQMWNYNYVVVFGEVFIPCRSLRLCSIRGSLYSNCSNNNIEKVSYLWFIYLYILVDCPLILVNMLHKMLLQFFLVYWKKISKKFWNWNCIFKYKLKFTNHDIKFMFKCLQNNLKYNNFSWIE